MAGGDLDGREDADIQPRRHLAARLDPRRGIVVGDGDEVEPRVRRPGDQLFGRERAIGCVSMKVEVDPHRRQASPIPTAS